MNKKNTYIVDDLDEVQIENKGNVFPAEYFDILNDPEHAINDNFLMKLQQKMERKFHR